MKKRFIFFVFILAVCAVPWFIGLSIQQAAEQEIEKFNSYPGYEVKLLNYSRGFLSSEAKVKVAYALAQATHDNAPSQALIEQMREGIVLDLTIQHGPLLSKPSFSFGLSYTRITLNNDQAFVAAAKSAFDIDELVTAEINMQLDGQGEGQLFMPALRYKEDDSELLFGGVQLDLSFSDFGKRQTSQGEIKAFSFSDAQFQVESSPIHIEGEGEIGESIFTESNFELKLSKLSVNGPSSANIEGLSIIGEISKASEDKINIDYTLALAQFDSSDMPYVLSETVLDLSLKSLKKDALETYSELATNMDTSSPEAQLAAQQKMQEVAFDLLGGSPEIHINNFTFKLGETSYMDLHGKVTVDGSVANNGASKPNPMMLIPAITANHTANLSEGLLTLMARQYMSQQLAGMEMTQDESETMLQAQSVQMIEQFTAMGFLEKTDTGYRIHASFKGGQLAINGKPMPLPL